MTVQDAQVRKLMEEMTKHGRIGVAAVCAGMDRKTARKYVTAEQLPSGMKQPRSWRTRLDLLQKRLCQLEPAGGVARPAQERAPRG